MCFSSLPLRLSLLHISLHQYTKLTMAYALDMFHHLHDSNGSAVRYLHCFGKMNSATARTPNPGHPEPHCTAQLYCHNLNQK